MYVHTDSFLSTMKLKSQAMTTVTLGEMTVMLNGTVGVSLVKTKVNIPARFKTLHLLEEFLAHAVVAEGLRCIADATSVTNRRRDVNRLINTLASALLGEASGQFKVKPWLSGESFDHSFDVLYQSLMVKVSSDFSKQRDLDSTIFDSDFLEAIKTLYYNTCMIGGSGEPVKLDLENPVLSNTSDMGIELPNVINKTVTYSPEMDNEINMILGARIL